MRSQYDVKAVLVPLDGSEIAEEGLRETIHFVDSSTRLTLITAVDIPQPIYSFDMALVTESIQPVDQAKLLQSARIYLENVASDFRLDNYEVQFVVRLGEPATVIAEIADALKVDAIIMSTHGRSVLSRLLFGSVTGKVLSIAHCPVMVVPSRKKVAAQDRRVSEVQEVSS